jgi:hypothetical protein
LKKYFYKIVKEENEMSALAFAMYEIVHTFVKDITKTIPDIRLVLVGGIQINMKKPIEDLFLPISFEVFEHDKPVKDLSVVFKNGKENDLRKF